MRKIVAMIMTTCLAISLAGCGNQQTSSANEVAEESTAVDTKVTTQESTATVELTESETTQTAEATEATEMTETTETTEMTEEITEMDGTTENIEENEAKALVVYFSNTGNTQRIAEYIANGTGADLYEIVAETPYTDADLNYNDDNSRSTKEMDDPSARPAIVGSVANMEQYDTVYIGYPIWWGEAPRILDTFVESYDFSGKTVIPFCTSGGSGMGSSASTLQSLAGTGTWLDGKRFSGSESEADVMAWVTQ